MKLTIKNAIKESQLDDEGFGNTTYLDYDEAIAELAYYKAENRGFEAGHDVQDWLDAERELLLDK
jgi:hypothetical protein